MKKIYSFLALFFTIFMCQAQAPAIQWQKTLGGSGNDVMYNAIPTSDGGYIFVGKTNSSDGDLTSNHSSGDAWVIKTDSQGEIQWQHFYGGSGQDDITEVLQTADGGFVFAGYSTSNDGNCVGNHGNGDIWLFKTSNLGIVQWTKMIGGSESDYILDIKQTNDGGFIGVGGSESNNGDATVNQGQSDYWVVKLTSTGVIQWQKSYGGTSDDVANSVIQTIDNNYLVSGSSQSANGDVLNHMGDYDYWILKLDGSGAIMWQKSLGGTDSEFALDAVELPDGSIVGGGDSASTDGDINVFQHGIWVVKLSSTGEIIWQRSYGGADLDYLQKIVALNDGGFLIAGDSNSTTGDVTLNNGAEDFWLFKITAEGSIQWQKNYGGSENEHIKSAWPTPDDGYIICGVTESNDGDISGAHGSDDGWVIKLGSAGPNFPVTPDFASLNSPAIQQSEVGVPITISGYVYVQGLTDVTPNIDGQAPGIQAWVGISQHNGNDDPSTWSNWTVATHNPLHVDANDEYSGSIVGLIPGTYYYATRFLLDDGSFTYGGIAQDNTGGIWDGITFQSGVLTTTQPTTSLAGTYNLTVDRLAPNAAQFTFSNEIITFTAFNEYRTTTVGHFYPSSGTPGSFGTVPLSQGVPGFTFNKVGNHFEVVQEMVFQYYGNAVFQTQPQILATSYNETTGTIIIDYSIAFSTGNQNYRNTYNPVQLATNFYDKPKLEFYPNPVRSILTITNIDTEAVVRVYNMLGQEVTPENLTRNGDLFDLSALKTGNYFITVTTPSNRQTIKVIKQ